MVAMTPEQRAAAMDVLYDGKEIWYIYPPFILKGLELDLEPITKSGDLSSHEPTITHSRFGKITIDQVVAIPGLPKLEDISATYEDKVVIAYDPAIDQIKASITLQVTGGQAMVEKASAGVMQNKILPPFSATANYVGTRK